MVDVRSRIVGKMLFAAVATAAVGAASACSAPEDPAPPKVGVTRSRLTVHPTTKRIRVAHWNTFARPSTGSVMAGSEGSADPVEVHGPLVADTVKRHMGEVDVIVFNELFTDIARKAVYGALKAEFPHWVKEIDGPLKLLPTANLSDSGLAIFSR